MQMFNHVNKNVVFQLAFLVIFLGLASAAPAGIGGISGHGNSLGGVSGDLSGGHGHGSSYDEKPDPFHFEYGVHDDKYHTDFSEHRSGDEGGNIKGEYTVALPDGRIQHVSYVADNYGGTTMEVSYKGEARHPDIVHHSDHGHGGHV